VRRWRPRSPTVRFSLHCRHIAALPRTAASCQEETLALQKTAPLFDHLVGANEKRLRHGQAERLGGLEIDHQLELGGGLIRQLAGLLAAKDAVDVGRWLPININIIAAAWSGLTDATRGSCIPPAVCTQPVPDLGARRRAPPIRGISSASGLLNAALAIKANQGSFGSCAPT
jgi:hypothetical protein